MMTDSQHLPSTGAIERALVAVEEARQEKARIRHIGIGAITLIAVGAIVGIGANIVLTAFGDGHLGWVRDWRETAHATGVAGVVLLSCYFVILAVLRNRETITAEMKKERRRPGAEDANASGGRAARMNQLLMEQADDAFVDELSAQVDPPNDGKVRRIRPRKYDRDWPNTP